MIADKTDPIFTPGGMLFTRWAVYSLINQKSYKSLSLAQPSHSSPEHSLPSWAPDWEGLQTSPTFLNSFDIQSVDERRSICESGPAQLQHLSSSARIFIAESEKMAVEAFAPHRYPFEAFWRTLICNTTRDGATRPSLEYAESFKAYKDYNDKYGPEVTLHSDNDGQWLEKRVFVGLPYEQAFGAWSTGRLFGVSREHRMGMFPNTTYQGDIICAFTRANTPFVSGRKGTASTNL